MAAADGPRAPDHVEIVAHPLIHDDVVKRVADDGAGAIVTFIGTTRDTFEYRGEVRNVEKLEYECFTPMALAKMRELCAAVRGVGRREDRDGAQDGNGGSGREQRDHSGVERAPKEALEACHWAIDELKATVPIWKKEFFEGGEVWKENAEQRDASRGTPRGANTFKPN